MRMHPDQLLRPATLKHCSNARLGGGLFRALARAVQAKTYVCVLGRVYGDTTMKLNTINSGKVCLQHGICRRLTFMQRVILGALLCLGSAARLEAQQATLQISSSGITNVDVQWNTAGTLQMANSLNGPWTTVTNAISITSSTITPPTGPARFFRVVGSNGVAGEAVALLPSTLTAPLQVAQATMQLLSNPTNGGNTLVTLTPVPGSMTSTNPITLLINNTLTQLSPIAGGSNWSAVVQINTSQLTALNAEIANLPASAQITTEFSDRAIVGTNVLQTFPLSNFLSGQVITFFPFGPTIGSTACAGSTTAYNPLLTCTIIDTSVVNDPNRTWDPAMPNIGNKRGAWTFGTLITAMANVGAPGNPVPSVSDFVLFWLNNYAITPSPNGDPVPPVPNVQTEVIAPWQAATAAEGGFPPGAVDVTIAPFRLLAIVNRVDLHSSTTYGVTPPSSPVPQEFAGEARFVFEVTSSTGAQLGNGFTVILEYAVPNVTTCEQLQNWASQWANLNTLGPLPNANFNTALQKITDQFALAGANPSQFPNQSAIAQVRANDFIGTQSGAQWELRQFNISDGTAGGMQGFLTESTVAATPAFSLNNTCAVEDFISGNASAGFCAPNTTFPTLAIPAFEVASSPCSYIGNFLGGWAPEEGGVFWSFSGLTTPSDVLCTRHVFSLNTCNGCHTSETGTAFLHVAPRAYASPSALSGFLTGTTVPDPFNTSVGPYHYADLARRVQVLNSLVTCPCGMQFVFPIFDVVHGFTE